MQCTLYSTLRKNEYMIRIQDDTGAEGAYREDLHWSQEKTLFCIPRTCCLSSHLQTRSAERSGRTPDRIGGPHRLPRNPPAAES